MANKISLIVPVYNEENSIGPFLKRTLKVLRSLVGDSYEIIFCLDPSDDNTFEVIKNYCLKNKTNYIFKKIWTTISNYCWTLKLYG